MSCCELLSPVVNFPGIWESSGNRDRSHPLELLTQGALKSRTDFHLKSNYTSSSTKCTLATGKTHTRI